MNLKSLFWKKQIGRKTGIGPPRISRHTIDEDRQSIERLRRIGLVAGGVVLIVVVGFFGLNFLKKKTHRMNRYRFDPSKLAVTDETSEWIRANKELVALLERGHGLEGYPSIFDEDFSPTIIKSYKKNPWVRRVLSVEKRSSKVQVDLELRRPVAGVKYKSAYYLIDRDGIRLPGKYRNWPLAWIRVPLVENARQAPPAPGLPWNEKAVYASARLAEEVDKYKDRFIDVNGKKVIISVIDNSNFQGRKNPNMRDFVLVTEGRTKILYGHSPLKSYYAGEESARRKMEKFINNFLAKYDPNKYKQVDLAIEGECPAILRTQSGLVSR